MGELKPLDGSIDLDGSRNANRLSAAADRHRPKLPDLGVRLCRHGAVARNWRFRGLTRSESGRRRGACSLGLQGFANRRDWLPLGRAVSAVLFARLLLQDAASSCSTSRSAPSTQRPSPTDPPDRRWHAKGARSIAALHDFRAGARDFPTDAAAGARGGGLGPNEKVLTPRTWPSRASSTEAWDEEAASASADERRQGAEPA